MDDLSLFVGIPQVGETVEQELAKLPRYRLTHIDREDIASALREKIITKADLIRNAENPQSYCRIICRNTLRRELFVLSRQRSREIAL